jgi:hypothetical protein
MIQILNKILHTQIYFFQLIRAGGEWLFAFQHLFYDVLRENYCFTHYLESKSSGFFSKLRVKIFLFSKVTKNSC